MNRDDRFLRKEYFRNLFPIMFSVLGGTINALIDSVFVSQRLGADGLAAVNMSMPIYLVICTFGCLIAGGASVMSAQAIGDKRPEDAEQYYHCSLLLDLIVGGILTILGKVLCHPLANALAQNGSLRDRVYIYCLVTFMGTIPILFAYLPLYFLQLEGKNGEISMMMYIMIGMDVILDYVFLYMLDLGIFGAALASVLASTLACLYGFVALEKGYSNFHLKIRFLSLQQFKSIVGCGSPIALGNLVDAVKLLLINSIVFLAGGPKGAAVWAALNCLSEFSLCITSGVPQAAAPMAGTYYAARENSGLRILIRLQLQAGLVLSVLYSLILLVLHKPLMQLFVIDENLFFPLVCLGLFCLLDTVCSIWGSFFNVTEKIALANKFVFLRKLFFPVIMALILMLTGGYLWSFMPIASCLTLLAGLVLTQVMALKGKDTEHALSKILLLDDYLERTKKVIDFSIVSDTESICMASDQIKGFCAENQMDRKQTVRLGLAIEELMTVLTQKNGQLSSVDLRAFSLEDRTGIRIRCAGERYNPFQESDEDDDAMMGVVMLQKMAEEVQYTYSLGVNSIYIRFSTNKEKGEK